jgi:REP element-mobilizing transposase RayT
MTLTHTTFRRRLLPHYDVRGGVYFITACLAGSLPARGLLRNAAPSLEAFNRHDDWLDDHAPVRWCADRRVAAIVRDGIQHFEGERYHTLAYVVMPSHFHWVFHAAQEWDRPAILKSLKSYTALRCNRLLGRGGAFWQAESYDRVLRDDEEMMQVVNYVEFNPVKAGLCGRPEEWEFSSAWRSV